MNCSIYKSSRKEDVYIYVEKEGDFSRLPETLLNMMGELKFVMNLELDAGRKLAQADVVEVRAKLKEEGFYLQMPQKDYLGT